MVRDDARLALDLRTRLSPEDGDEGRDFHDSARVLRTLFVCRGGGHIEAFIV